MDIAVPVAVAVVGVGGGDSSSILDLDCTWRFGLRVYRDGVDASGRMVDGTGVQGGADIISVG